MRHLLLICIALGMNLAFAQEKAIYEKVVVKAKPEEVFKAWTTTEGIKSFFAPDANVELRVDGPFEVYMNPYADKGMKGADDMRILNFQENRMVSFTWNAPPNFPETRKQRTYVTVRMTPQGESETLVTLYHGGWGEGGQWDQTHAYFSKAWVGVLGNLKKRFDAGPTDWTEWLKRMKAFTEGQKKAS